MVRDLHLLLFLTSCYSNVAFCNPTDVPWNGTFSGFPGAFSPKNLG